MHKSTLKNIISILLVLTFVLFSSQSIFSIPSADAAQDEYDPLHTMLALNMAIVSVHKIVNTGDKFVLTQEYENIINNLSIANIEKDPSMIWLFDVLMEKISSKQIRQEEARMIKNRYDRQEQRQLVSALSGIRAYGGNLISWLGSLAVSCVSQYFSYEDSKAQLEEELNEDLWKLKKEELEDCDELQRTLLRSSWDLLRDYKLPEEYRLVQKDIDDFNLAITNANPQQRLRMLQDLESAFRVYPPYWFYRAQAARTCGDLQEEKDAFDQFDAIWRPVVRNDPYKAEAIKYRIMELTRNSDVSATKRVMIQRFGELRDVLSREDWANNLFTGVGYFVLGEEKSGMNCVLRNIDFNKEADVSKVVLSQMQSGKLDPNSLPNALAGLVSAIESMDARYMPNISDTFENALKDLFEGRHDKAEKAFANMVQSHNPVVFWILRHIERSKPNSDYTKITWLTTKFVAVLNGRESEFPKILPLTEYYANDKNLTALTLLGSIYAYGRGVTQDTPKAIKYLEDASNKGDRVAQLTAALIYDQEGKNDQAMKYFKMAAEQGDAEAQFVMAVYYANGLGVSANDDEVERWLIKAAEQGYDKAQYEIGRIYSRVGGKQDFGAASNWYRKAAEQGNANAQKGLSVLYANGNGVPQSFKSAYMWAYVSYLTEQDTDTNNIMIQFGDRLSVEEITAARKEGQEEHSRIQSNINRYYK